MRWKPSFWGTVALLFGAFFAACEVYGAYGYLAEQQKGIDYIVLMGTGIAGAVPIIPPMADVAGRNGWYFWKLVLWLLLPLALLVVIISAVQRTSSNTDSAQHDREQLSLAKSIASKAERDAEAALDMIGPVRSLGDIEADIGELQRSYIFDRSKQCKDATARDSRELCANLDRLAGERLKAAEAERYRKALRDARAKLAELAKSDTQEEDPLARRIEAFTAGWISQEQFRLYQPLFIPLLASVFSGAFLTIGVRCDFHISEETIAEPHKVELPAAVVEPVPVEAISMPAEPITHDPTPAPPQISVPPRPRPKLAAANRQPVGAVLDFMHDAMEFKPGPQTDMAETFIAYSDWCKAHDCRPLDVPRFVDEVDALCRKFGILSKNESGRHYLLDVQLKQVIHKQTCA